MHLDPSAQSTHLIEHLGHERLTAKPRFDRHVGDKVTIHDINLYGLRTGALNDGDGLRQVAEVRRQNGRYDPGPGGHCRSCSSTMMPFTKIRARARPFTVTGKSIRLPGAWA